MSESLFSQSWYRVRDLRLKLRPHAQIHRHVYRGEPWYVMQDHSSGKFHRFSPSAYYLLGLMDGKRTLHEIWEAACRHLGDAMPGQDEVLSLLGMLHRADVLHGNQRPDIADLGQRQRKEKRNRWLQQLRSPLSVRIPLIDPDRFLARTLPLVRPLMSGFGALLWLLVVGYAALQATVHWAELTDNVTERVLSLQGALALALIYPLIKALHELGHGYAVKRWGGEVHEMGIMLLVFLPIPYVDASSATSFRSKYQRMLVGAAGIGVELFLAALAMIVWVEAEPGLLRALLFNVMLVGGVSTVLFNGNPLLRFDAYYVLADALEIPNLGSKGNQTIGALIKRHLLRMRGVEMPLDTRAETRWAAVYAVVAFAYRMVVIFGIILLVATKFLFVGILLAIWALVGTLVLPLVNIVKRFNEESALKAKSARAAWLTLLLVGSVAAFVALVPLPLTTYTQGVVWAPEQAVVRAGAPGFVVEVLAAPDSEVTRGTPLIRMEATELQLEADLVAAQLAEAQARLTASIRERADAEVIREEVAHLEDARERALERLDELRITSRADGTFLLPEAVNLPGRHVQRGAELGYVVDYRRVPVRALVAESDIDLVRHGTVRIEARLGSDTAATYPVRSVSIVPAITHELPSPALGLEGGGRIALDPQAKEGELRSLEPHFRVDAVVEGLPVERIGERVHLLFVHDEEPLAGRLYRAVRRLFLSRFDA